MSTAPTCRAWCRLTWTRSAAWTAAVRALYEAVAAQGIAGVLARRRTSPYLPGVRSALWRSIVAAPARETDPGEADPAEPSVGEPLEEPTSGTAPVLALFRRLPFDEDPAE